MNRQSIRKKPLGTIMLNYRNLPSQIAGWDRKGELDKADMGRRMLADVSAEIIRRRGLEVKS